MKRSKIKKVTCWFAGIIFSVSVNCLNAQPKWEAPEIIHLRENIEKYTVESRQFTGIPSIAVTPVGRMWAIWYAGSTPNEDHNNYVVLSTSSDGGTTWEEVLVIDPDSEGPLRAFDPQVWIAPDNSLWVFCAIGVRNNTYNQIDTWFIKTDDPDNKNAVWSDWRFLGNGVMMNKPTVLTSGEWLFPVALWSDNKDIRSGPLHDNSAKVYISRDKGVTIRFLGACNIPADARRFDEHMVVERKDDSLWMLVRTEYGIGESVSTNRGQTWSELQPSKIMHPGSRFFITRLLSGDLLLVKNGPINVKTYRSHMMAFLSNDDGHTWSSGLIIDQGSSVFPFKDVTGVSYPDGQQTKDGRIHIIYDCNRITDQLILKTDFTETDILDPHYDAAMIRAANNRKVVSKGGSK